MSFFTRDVFYFGEAPNAHPRERKVANLAEARELATTDHFWIINEWCDYSNFDWDFDFDALPSDERWAQDHDNVWPSQHQKDSGTWLCPKETKGYIIYRADVYVNRIHEVPYWTISDDVDRFSFDFTWHHDPTEPPFIYRWGNGLVPPEEHHVLEYTVPGATQFKFMHDQKVKVAEPSVFFVDRHNQQSSERFETILHRFPTATKVRFVGSWMDTIKRCANKSPTPLFWVLDSMVDYSNCSFDFYPGPWQFNLLHILDHQWHKWGTTYLVNRDRFIEDTKYIERIEHFPAINFIRDSKAIIDQTHERYLIDFGNPVDKSPYAKVVKFDGSYLKTLRQLENRDKMVWICTSISDYSRFDFSYTPDPFMSNLIHVFPTSTSKYGDTFLVNLKTLAESLEGIETLYSAPGIQFNRTMSTTRVEEPTIVTGQSHAREEVSFDFPYATLLTTDLQYKPEIEPPNYWNNESETIIVQTKGGSCITVPYAYQFETIGEVYDYPKIATASALKSSPAMDIVFLSNGEPNAEQNFAELQRLTAFLPNRVVRVDGVKGRVNAYHAAAKASNTPWFFTVFGKLAINPEFDFSWQPDRLQDLKHYIFYAKNPVNGLEYGHMGMIVYHKELVLSNPGIGLDFTLDSAHAVVPVLSGTARFNTDPVSTWRTAFRECLKLCSNSDQESIDRLNTWMTVAEGDYSEWSVQGAKDAIEYHKAVSGSLQDLKLSYDWEWLNKYYEKKYH